MKRINLIYVMIAALFFGACESHLEQKPVDLITDEILIEDESTAEAAILGMYSNLQIEDQYGHANITLPGLLSDELSHSGSFPTQAQFDDSDIIADNVDVRDYWSEKYTGIYIANTVMERLGELELDAAVEKQLVAEAKFGRALNHFNLVKMFGGIPVANTSNLEELKVLDRTSEADSYAFIIQDLKEAAEGLAGVDHGSADFNRTRATEYAAKALLARVYLYIGDVENAGKMADDVIKNGGYALEADYADIFDETSDESIFQVFASSNDGTDLAFWLLPDGRFEFAVSNEMMNTYEDGDARKDASVTVHPSDPQGRFYVAKYPDVATGTDQPIAIRLAEMYLIRAEANLGSAQADADINALRERAFGDASKNISGATLNDVLHERMVELAFEGHRWNDLKRTGKLNEVMSVINPNNWESTDALLPIPQNEINQNPTLQGKQNPGY
jgi:starch-binding outer membrane protein, SusD/RagB family